MQLKTEALVIHSLRYGEADLIAKLYTQKEGLHSYLIRGVLKSKKGKIRSSFFQPLSLLEVDAIHNNKGKLCRLKEVKPVCHFTSLHTNIVKGCITSFIAEIINQVFVENQPDEELFFFLKNTVFWLNQNEKVSIFPHFFLIKLSAFLGFYPDTTNSNLPQFNLIEGKFELGSKSGFCITNEELNAFTYLMKIELSNLHDHSLEKFERNRLLENLILYFSLHIENFKKPKSLGVIKELLS